MLAFDAKSNGLNTGTTLTISHTCTGSNLILFAAVNIPSGKTCTGVTYNSVAMTQVPTNSPVTQPGGNLLYLFYLIAPATGTHNIVYSISSSDTFRGVAASYTGAKQSSQPDNSAKATQTSLDHITNALVPNVGGVWIVAATANDVDVASDGTNYKNRDNSAGVGIGDTNAAVSGSTSQTVNTSGSANWGIIQASIAPVPSATGGFITNFL